MDIFWNYIIFLKNAKSPKYITLLTSGSFSLDLIFQLKSLLLYA